MRHLSVSTYVLLPRLGLARKIGSTQESASWTPVMPPSPATAIFAVCHGFCRRCWTLPLPPPASAASGRCRRRCRLLPLSTAAATASRCCRHRRTLPPLPTIVANRCCRRRRRRPLPLPPPASINAVHCRRRRQLQPPSTAATAGSSRRRLPWSTWGPRVHHGWWRRILGPGQSRPRLPQSSRCIPKQSAYTGHYS